MTTSTPIGPPYHCCQSNSGNLLRTPIDEFCASIAHNCTEVHTVVVVLSVLPSTNETSKFTMFILFPMYVLRARPAPSVEPYLEHAAFAGDILITIYASASSLNEIAADVQYNNGVCSFDYFMALFEETGCSFGEVSRRYLFIRQHYGNRRDEYGPWCRVPVTDLVVIKTMLSMIPSKLFLSLPSVRRWLFAPVKL